MKTRYSDYPIGKALLEAMADSGLSSHDFFCEIGYRNVTKAMRALDEWLQRGDGNPVLLERLQASRLAIPAETFAELLAANQVMVDAARLQQAQAAEQRARERFVPRLAVIPEFSRPTCSITIFALMGGNERYNHNLPPDIATWPLEAQLTHVKQLAQENFATHDGKTLNTGRICGYTYQASFDEAPVRLTIDGALDTSNEPCVRAVSASLHLKNGKDITGLLQFVQPATAEE